MMTDLQTFISHPREFELIIFLISIFGGFLGSILGLGGGIIIVPALTLIFGIHIRYAVGASIVAVIATSSGAAAAYVRDHITNIRVAMLLEIGTTLGALAGAILTPYLPAPFLFLGFSLLMLYSAWSMFNRKHQDQHPLLEGDSWATRLRLNSSYPDRALRKEVHYGVRNVPLGVCLMLFAGLLSSLLGIGSGSLKVPAMDTAMRLPIKVSTATSNFMIGVTGAASAGTYYMRGDILPLLAAPVALGVLLGSMLGAKMMTRLPGLLIRKLFVVILLLTACEMGWKAFHLFASHSTI